jgi:hypothetical protein
MVDLSSGYLSIKDPILQSHITQSFPLNLTSIPGHYGQINSCLTLAALSSEHLSIMDIKLMKCTFELTFF